MSDTGINQYEFELCAWLVGGFPGTLVAKKFGDDDFTYFLRQLDPDRPPEVESVAGNAGRPPHFPWGWPVLPDA